jgi:hypothetical protein
LPSLSLTQRLSALRAAGVISAEQESLGSDQAIVWGRQAATIAKGQSLSVEELLGAETLPGLADLDLQVIQGLKDLSDQITKWETGPKRSHHLCLVPPAAD